MDLRVFVSSVFNQDLNMEDTEFTEWEWTLGVLSFPRCSLCSKGKLWRGPRFRLAM